MYHILQGHIYWSMFTFWAVLIASVNGKCNCVSQADWEFWLPRTAVVYTSFNAIFVCDGDDSCDICIRTYDGCHDTTNIDNALLGECWINELCLDTTGNIVPKGVWQNILVCVNVNIKDTLTGDDIYRKDWLLVWCIINNIETRMSDKYHWWWYLSWDNYLLLVEHCIILVLTDFGA